MDLLHGLKILVVISLSEYWQEDHLRELMHEMVYQEHGWLTFTMLLPVKGTTSTFYFE
ncbi:MAG: hypothetical protein ACFFD4_13345 [Candidatus Odinarchaeota archaeon]